MCVRQIEKPFLMKPVFKLQLMISIRQKEVLGVDPGVIFTFAQLHSLYLKLSSYDILF